MTEIPNEPPSQDRPIEADPDVRRLSSVKADSNHAKPISSMTDQIQVLEMMCMSFIPTRALLESKCNRHLTSR